MVLVRYTLKSLENIDEIVNNTSQTWQPDRNIEETRLDTKQGKIAEDVLQKFITDEQLGINIISYDKIRTDDFKKHAPFDFLMCSGDTPIDDIVDSIHKDIASSDGNYVKVSRTTKNLCTSKNVKIVEVKSTKITKRHKEHCSFIDEEYDDLTKTMQLAKEIQKDDFLTYPYLLRKTNNRYYSEDDYINLLNRNKVSITVKNRNEMLDYECKKQLCDIFVRIYIDEMNKVAFVVGWIDKYSFYKNASLKPMKKRTNPNWHYILLLRCLLETVLKHL